MADTAERRALLAKMRAAESRFGESGSSVALSQATRYRAELEAMDALPEPPQ